MAEFFDVKDVNDVAAIKAAIEEHSKKPAKDRARLRFVNASITNGNFSFVDAADVVFLKGELRGCSFRHALLAGSEFQGVDLTGADFTRAILVGALFVDDGENGATSCNLSNVKLFSVTATGAAFNGANLTGAKAQGGIFNHADFTGASLKGANLDGADLRDAIGVELDETSARGTIFDRDAADPWSRLRSTYTGPNLIVSLATYLSFVAGLAAKAFALYILSVAQAATLSGKPILEVATLKLSEAACAIPNVKCGSTTVLEVLLGLHEGFLPAAFAIVILVYSILRFVMTVTVATMHDQEERTGVSPQLNPDKFRKPAGRPAWKTAWALAKHVAAGLQTYGWLRPIDVFLRYFKWIALASLVAGWITLLAAPLPTVTLL